MIRQRMRAHGWDLLICTAFLAFPLLLYAGITIGPHSMLPADNLFQWAPWQSAASRFGAEIPHNSLISDLVIQNLVWKQFVLESLAAGEIPLWNPHLFAGVPFLASGQHSALYPFSILYYILPLTKAYGWFALSQVWLAGVFMYIFGRILHLRRGSAALSGLIYQGGSFVVVSAAVFPMILAAVIWLPLLLGTVEKVIQTAVWRNGRRATTLLWAGTGAVALGLQALAGHAEFTYYTLLIMGLYALWRLISVGLHSHHHGGENGQRETSQHGLLKAAGWLMAMVILGLMFAGIQLIPLFEVGQVNFREGSTSYAEVLSYAYPWRNLMTLILPNFFGNPAHHAYRDVLSGQIIPFAENFYGRLNPHGAFTSSWGIKNYVEGAYYMGILPLILAVLGGLSLVRYRLLPAARRAQTLFFIVLGLVSVAFIFGTPLYALLFYGLPFINQLHTPFRWVFPLLLSVAVLAGFGSEVVFKSAADDHDNLSSSGGMTRLVRWGGGLVFFAGTMVLTGLLASWLFYGQLEGFLEQVFLGLTQAPDTFSSVQAFYSYQFWQVLVLGMLLVGSGLALLFSRRREWVLLAAAVIVVDLAFASAGFNSAVDPALLNYQPEAVTWLQEQPGQWRLTTFDPGGDNPFNANTPWLKGLEDIRGYDSIIPRQFTEYMAAIEPQNGLQFNRVQPITDLAALNSPLLDILTVRYVASTEEIDLPKLKPVWQGEGVTIYENLAVAPRAYILPQSATVVAADTLAAMQAYDPRQFVVTEESSVVEGGPTSAVGGTLQAATIDQYGNNEVVVTAEALEPSWLVLNDSYFPGWRAYVRPVGADDSEEQEVDIHLVNGNFRGVLIESGEWAVRFRYSPRSFQLGGLTSFMGMMILLFAGGVWLWRQLYRPDLTTTAGRSLAKNSAAPMALSLFNKGIDFAFAAYYLRVLGPAGAGGFATAIATAGIFEIMANYGLNILLIREVSQDKSKAGSFLFNSSILRLGISLLAALPIFIYIWSSRNSPNPLSSEEILAIILMMIGMVFSGLALGVSGLFYVHEEAEVPAAMSTITTMLKVGLGVAVLALGYSFVGLAGVSIVVNLVTLIILSIMAFRRYDLGGRFQLDPTQQRTMLRLGFPLMLIHLLQTIFISVDVLLLRQLLPNGEEVVGWYNSAYKWFNALQIIPSYFTLALFPIISHAITKDRDSARRMYGLSLKLMLLLALPIAALTMFSAPLLIGLLGGREFLPHGAIALQIVIWSIPFGWLNSVTNYVLIGLGLEGMQPRAFALAVGFNVIANWLLIPRYSYVAAAVTTILSEVVLLVIFDYFLRQRMKGIDWFRFAAKPALLTALMVAVMWVANQANLILALVAGVVVYAGGLWVLRIIGPDEKRALSTILPLSLAQRLRLLDG